MTAVYAEPAPAALTHHANGRACHKVIVDAIDDPIEPTEVLVTETSVGEDDATHDVLPFALTPPPISTGALKTALAAVAGEVRAALPQLPRAAYIDILTRRPPRMHSGGSLPRSGDDIA